MNLIHRASPGYLPPSLQAESGFQIVRQRILQALLLGIVAVGSIGILILFLTEMKDHDVNQPLLYGGLMALLVVILFWRELPYSIRAGAIPFFAYFLAVAELFDSSLLAETQFWLVAFTTLVSLLFGLIPALFSIALAIGTVAVMGIGVQYHWFTIPYPASFALGPGWALSATTLALVAMGIAAATSGLISGMRRFILERETLSKELEQERSSLENRIITRTHDTERRLAQVRTAAEISNIISRLSDPELLYHQVVSLMQERLNLYYVGLFQIDELNRYAILRAGSGEAGQTMLSRGHRLQIGGGSMIGWCIANRRPRIALDVGTEAVRFNNPNLPLTRSELALPILIRGEALGALSVQSELAEAFDQDDILVMQGIADSLATAIDNARLVGELQQNLDELRNLNRGYVRSAWSEVTAELGSLSVSFESKTLRGTNLHSVEVPILLRDQEIARLTMDTSDTRMSVEDQAFLEALTTQTALALENARLVEETERRAEQEKKLNELSVLFSRAFDIEGILQTAVEELAKLPGIMEASVELVHPGPSARAETHSEEGETA